MSTHTYPVSVAFHDVAACFSAEEWAELKDWQKDLYKKVMLEIHSALEAMGFEILNRDVLFCIKKVKDLYIDICETERAVSSEAPSPRDPGKIMGMKQEHGPRLDCCRKKSAKSTTHHVGNPDLLLRIKQDDPTRQSPAHADPIVTSVFSLQKDKEEPHLVESTESRTVPANRRLASQTIKQEKADYVKVSVGGHGLEGSAVTPAVWPSSQLMQYEEPDYMKVSVQGAGPHSTEATGKGQVTAKPIKEEEPEYIKVSVGGPGPVSISGASRDTGEPILHICDTASPSQFPATQFSNALGSQSTSSPSPGVPRLRIVKFTEKELDVLVDLVIENYSKLFGNEADITPSMAKNSMWQAIANEVSAVGVASRTSDKVKKRWKDAKRKMNEKLSEAAAHVAETGRRPPPHLRLAPYEQRLRDFFKPEYSKEVDWNQDKEDLPEEVEAEPIECVHQEASISFSSQCQDTAEDSSKDSSEEPSIISPDRQPHHSDIIEERETAPEFGTEPHNHQHQFSAISSTLHNLTSHQRESNLLMQEQNAILSQIAHSLNLLQIQQTDGLAALGSIIQKGIEVIRPPSCIAPNDRTTENPNVHTGLRRQVKSINNTDQPVPPKRKIT